VERSFPAVRKHCRWPRFRSRNEMDLYSAVRIRALATMKGDFVPRAPRLFAGTARPLPAARRGRLEPSLPARKTCRSRRPIKNESDLPRWYEEELKAATGKTSTRSLRPEARLHESDGAFRSNRRRVDLLADAALRRRRAPRSPGTFARSVRANEVEEDYMRGMARRMLRLADD
jgi:hypothetical protein